MIERRDGASLCASELYALLRLRVDVFVVEQACPYAELDGRDLRSDTQHFWISSGDGVLAYLRVLTKAGGLLRIGRVCSARHARGGGLAARLMRAALTFAGPAECVLDAQTTATGFYARFGFVAEGDEFDEDGIAHITMRRVAAARSR